MTYMCRGLGACMLCCGEHQDILRPANCSDSDFKHFCNASAPSPTPRPGPGPPPPPSPPPRKDYYGDPKNGCKPDEHVEKITGLSGAFSLIYNTHNPSKPLLFPAVLHTRFCTFATLGSYLDSRSTNRYQHTLRTDTNKNADLRVPGSFCSPSCSSSSPCPTDVPGGGTALPQCVLESSGAQNPTNCALVCHSTFPYGTCPAGAQCQHIQNTAICTYAD